MTWRSDAGTGRPLTCPRCGAIAATPHAKRLAELPVQHQYAAMALWRGTMTAHSVVVHRDGAGESAPTVCFDDGQWLQFVPIRLPWTQLVQEGLPAGAAGRLLNGSHPYRDLILALDTVDKRLFDGIDGRRRIATIAESASADRRRTRGFFENLWCHDQVVFDASSVG